MKLFITNKKEFDIYFQDESNKYHKQAYNELNKVVNLSEVIPIYINIDDCTFELKKFSSKENIYFYEALY